MINSLISKKIVEISCGDHHSVALSSNGELFTWGGGGQYNRGQCGHGDLKERKIALSIKALEVEEEKRAIEEYGSKDSGASLGEILGVALGKDFMKSQPAAEKPKKTKK